MSKQYRLSIYQLYWHYWRVISFLLLALSLVMLVFTPQQVRDYRAVLMLTAGLGALVLVLGFAMTTLSFVAVGRRGVVVQLPLWRIQIPFEHIQSIRVVTLGSVAPGQWKDADMAELSALLVELNRWSQPRPLLRFWLGRTVLGNAVVLPVDDVLGLHREVDDFLLQLRDSRLIKKTDEWPRPFGGS